MSIMSLPAYLWTSLTPTVLTAVIFVAHYSRQPVCVSCLALRALKPARRWPWSGWLERRRRYANSIGRMVVVDADSPAFADLAEETWASPAGLSAVQTARATPRRHRSGIFEPAAPPPPIDWLSPTAPGRPAPRTPAEAVSRKARHGHPLGYWAVDVPPLQDTQLMPAVVDEEAALSVTAEFYALTRANWRAQELEVLAAEHRCSHCLANDHRSCPGCGCLTCLEAYVGEEVSRG